MTITKEKKKEGLKRCLGGRQRNWEGLGRNWSFGLKGAGRASRGEANDASWAKIRDLCNKKDLLILTDKPTHVHNL